VLDEVISIKEGFGVGMLGKVLKGEGPELG